MRLKDHFAERDLQTKLLRETIKVAIRENLDNHAAAVKTMRLMNESYEIAKKFVDGLAAGKRNPALARELKEHVELMQTAAQWLLNHRAVWAEDYAKGVVAAEKLTKKSGFWKTPKFINVDDHVSEMQGHLNTFQKLKTTALKAARKSFRTFPHSPSQFQPGSNQTTH